MASERTIGAVDPSGGLDEPPTANTADHTQRLLRQSTLASENGGLGAVAPPPGRRLFRPQTVVPFLLGLAILYLVYRRGFDLRWSELWASVASANAALLVLAFAAFYCSFPIRALRWRALLGNVGYARAAGTPLPSSAGLVKIMYLASFANCITIARLGDAYRAYLLRNAAGVSFVVTLGTILVERLLDLFVLAAMLSTTALVGFRGALLPEATDTLVVGLILSAIGVCGFFALRRSRGGVARVLPARWHAHYELFERGTVGSFRRIPLLIAYSAVGWIVEGLALYLTAASVGTRISAADALVVALVASLLTTVPFAPSGLGFTEAGTVLLLQWLGLDTEAAVAVAILFRAINYWSIVAFGSVLYVFARNGSPPPRLRPRQPAATREGPAGSNDATKNERRSSARERSRRSWSKGSRDAARRCRTGRSASRSLFPSTTRRPPCCATSPSFATI